MNDKTTLLYIDDEPINLMLFTAILKDNCDIVTGLSGFDGLEKLDKHPDIKFVFSDMKMPGMDGIEFVKQARQKFPDITYFLVTGYDINEEINKAIENKLIAKYFNKPFDIKEIRKTIDSIKK